MNFNYAVLKGWLEGASFAGLTLKDVPRGTAQSGATMGDIF